MEACLRPHGFMLSFKRQSFGRERKILEKLKKSKKSKNTVVRTLGLSTTLSMCVCVCVCRLYLRIIMCGRVSDIYYVRGKFEVVSCIFESLYVTKVATI